MRKNKKALLCVAFSILFATNANSAELAAASIDHQGGSASVGNSKSEQQMEVYNQFTQLVQQQKYDEALTMLHDVAKLDSFSILNMIMMLDNREQARAVMAQFFGKYQPAPEERVRLHGYAVDLSHNQNFSESLMLLRWLYETDMTDKQVLYDYVVVLNWSGNNRSAVDLFEKEKLADPPNYVLMSVGGAYYKLGNYQKALSYFDKVAATGDRKATIWQAQAYYRAGDVSTANRIYDALLAQNQSDIEVLRSRGTMKMLAKNYTEALVDFKQVLTLAAGMDNTAEIKRTVDYDMAIAHIRLNEEAKAIVLLKPYIDDGTADVFMQSDYILALRVYRDYKTAIAEATRLWPDHGKVPVFGLQAYADSYLRTGQVQKAMPIYEHILKRDANANGAKLGLAFARMLSGKISEGLQVYDELITAEPALGEVALDDAFFFNEQGRYEAGTRLFNLLVTRFPDNALYRQEYAGSLANNNMPRDAYDQYKALSKLSGKEAAGMAGMASSAVEVGNYGKAGELVSKLQEKYSEDVLAQQAVKAYEERRKGGADAGFVYQRDYKGIETQVWQLNADETIGNSSYAVLAQVRRNKITDFNANPQESTTLNSQALGFGHKGMRSDIQAWYHNYQNNGTFSGYNVITNYHPNDRLTFGLDVSRIPLEDVQALNPALAGSTLGRIMTTNYTLRTQILSGNKDRYDISFTHSLYSDNNRVNNYDVSWTRTALFNEKKQNYWFVFFNRGDYRLQQPDLYESPPTRDGYGFGITQRWLYPKNYWEASSIFEWGRDRPEPIDFQPNFRLEYGYNFSPTRTLVLGAEYGLRTDRINNISSLGFNYRRYDFNYQFRW